MRVRAEDEVRKALLTGEALAVLPGVNNIGTLLVSLRFETNLLFLFFFTFQSGHNLVHNRRKTTPDLLLKSSFSIPESYPRDFRDVERLLLHDRNDPKLAYNQSSNLRSAGRVIICSSDLQLNVLFGCDQLHMDGTFSTAPPMFEQVFIIQAILHDTCEPY